MREVVVFLGPSLSHREAREILKAEYLPPARRGDIESAVSGGALVIGLIDGVFFQDCAVAHREILSAIRKGIRVIGASSMGALRAAELDVLGMEGVGEIYRMYREGVLESDDEVALAFDPTTGTALSEPLVNIRATLAACVEQGVLDQASHDRLLEIARAMYYPERTYRRLCMEAAGKVEKGALDRFCDFAGERPVDLKRQDAIAALKYIRERVLPACRVRGVQGES